MLRRLRFQLSFLYLLAAIMLVMLVGGGSYLLLRYYLEETTDLALQYKMAQEFRQYGIALPQELQQAERSWLDNNARITRNQSGHTMALSTPTRSPINGQEDEEGESHQQPMSEDGGGEDAFDGDLAAVFVFPLNSNGEIIAGSQAPAAPLDQDKEASSAALRLGSDLRTSRLPDDSQVRLLTYRIDVSGGPALLQVGRLLRDQQRVMNQFLTGLWILGGFSVFLLGVGSWWLSGRSLVPAQRAWDQQQVFVSNASHELRTPLTLIKATAEVGLRQKTGSDQRDALQDIRQECDYMDRLVDDLLLLSRLDTRRLKLSHERIEIRPVLEDAKRQMERWAVDKGIQILEGPVQGSVFGDPTRLRQVLLILLDNALRYTPSGGTIRLETQPSGKHWQILVSDTGSGISAKDLPHIFERFYQVSRPAVDDSRSNGLGLSIAKGLMDAQGGAISIDSQVGVGTRAILWLPAANLA